MTLFHLDSELLPTINGQRIGNPNRIALLEHIDRLGSITRAAKAVPMSYKAAWDAIDAMNNLSPQPLVVRQTGGKGGGTSTLTEFGRQFVNHYRRLSQLHNAVMTQLQQVTPDLPTTHLALWQRLNMHFSADNQLFGTISAIHPGAVNNELHLQLSNNLTLVGIATQSSCERMNLTEGTDAFALIQASAIIVSEPLNSIQLSARNRINARICRIHTGSINTEIVCDIGGNLTLSVVLTCTSAQRMKLHEEQSVLLLIKASSMVFGRMA